ncbi:MAG: maltose alpha-D-glucosyltransferase [SAR202 cluster bacterium]|nr:maltose alpha-D-glucosyltransferase [SAR202 cluster bacterium]
MVQTRTQVAPSEQDTLWYKDAIIYELHVRGFHDSDADGIGDFRGLTQKLDYLQDLGVTAIWLLPFYPSPLKDDGYDIADYAHINPSYGTMRDFRAFLRAAEQRGLRVITELVINHTSDQHPWFQRARNAPPGDKARDFYVWSDSSEKYQDARIIFQDFESSNWEWDPVAGAYYWHRFYRHQPDLNFDNPEVRREILRILDLYFNLGVSGLRLDAVPYLHERDGTNCENLPETHGFLKELRRHTAERFPDRMLLAEANQWPEDAASYFGDGDEAHMAFHFPVMPRLFMALRREDRFPIVDILQETPAIPETCQWALFLRNHDELTLEMVTDEERDYMYRIYARDRQMRVNVGIRRRLAPLLNNDRRKIELLNALLFSLPGTPVLYYGDEIGMGDNFYLGDRNGVRTPMQWNSDRNAGFSGANTQRLYLPVITDPEYHYEAVNVEIQQNNPDSMLWWMKRLIALRKRHAAFGRGTLEFLFPENSKILAFVRRYEDEVVLIVANLSRQAQHAFLDLSQFAGFVPSELFGQAEFPQVTEEPYFVTIGPYGFYWFSLQVATGDIDAPAVGSADSAVPTLDVRGDWLTLFRREARSATSGVLISYLRGRRWFGGKARTIRSLAIQDVIHMKLNQDAPDACLLLAEVEYAEGEPEIYALPLAYVRTDIGAAFAEENPNAIVARVRHLGHGDVPDGLIYDALFDDAFNSGLLQAVSNRRQFRGEVGEAFAVPSDSFRLLRGPLSESLTPTPLAVEQSNTSVAYGDRLIFKMFRRPGEGMNPDLEIGRFLTDQARFPHTPLVAGSLEYRKSRTAEPVTLGVLQSYVPSQGDAWQYTLDSLGHFFEQALAHPEVKPAIPSAPLSLLGEGGVPAGVSDTIGSYLESARLLGTRTAEFHLAMATNRADQAFAPQPFSDQYRRSRYQSMRNLTLETFALLRSRMPKLSPEMRIECQRVLDSQQEVIDRFGRILTQPISTLRIRCHGDYHLGQVLYTGNNFIIIDFEGEPARPLTERRIKRSPLRDVAGMIRSFHYATHAALLGHAPTVVRPEDLAELEEWSRLWYVWSASEFLESYREVLAGTPLIPTEREPLQLLLDVFLLEKAVYEVGYELNNRPDWLSVPLQGIIQLLESP